MDQIMNAMNYLWMPLFVLGLFVLQKVGILSPDRSLTAKEAAAEEKAESSGNLW